MRIGVFTVLLSQFPLDKVFEKLKTLDIRTVELGTGNYSSAVHCPLAMLNDRAALKEFKQKLDDQGQRGPKSVTKQQSAGIGGVGCHDPT